MQLPELTDVQCISILDLSSPDAHGFYGGRNRQIDPGVTTNKAVRFLFPCPVLPDALCQQRQMSVCFLRRKG